MHFDGGARPQSGLAGFGFVLRVNDDDQLGLLEGNAVLNRTCNEAEYMGCIAGLAAALSAGVTTLRVYGDSKLVINQVAGRWKLKADNLRPLYRIARRLAASFRRATFKHIPRDNNGEADGLVNDAMDSLERELENKYAKSSR